MTNVHPLEWNTWGSSAWLWTGFSGLGLSLVNLSTCETAGGGFLLADLGRYSGAQE